MTRDQAWRAAFWSWVLAALLSTVTAFSCQPSTSCPAPLPDYLAVHLDKSSPGYVPDLGPMGTPIEPGPSNSSNTLKFVTGLFRHGNRSPSKSYEGDPYPFYDPIFWPEGKKQLTKVGKNQLFQLGEKLRYRYDRFLGEEYRSNEVEIKSNLVDRDYMSAACLLASLYPPKGYQLWNKNLAWQPIPIWPQPYDIVQVTVNPDLCPSFYKEMMKAINSLNSYGEQHTFLINYLNSKTALNVSILSDFYRYWDIFSLQKDAGYELPYWLKLYYPEVANIYATGMAAMTSSNQKLIRLLAGPVLKELSGQLKAKAEGVSTLKLHLEAVHETSLNAVLPGFSFKEPFLVDPSALFLIELHQQEGKDFVQFLYYKNSKVEAPEVLLMKNCSQFCPLDKVQEYIEPLIPENLEKECKLNKRK